MDHEEPRARLRDACDELEDALQALRWVAHEAGEGWQDEVGEGLVRRHDVRLSQAVLSLRRAEERLQGAPGVLLFRVGLAFRRAARHLLPGRGPADLVQRELAHLERGLPRLRRLVQDEVAS